MAAPRPDRRSHYHASTGHLLLSFGNEGALMTLEQWEAYARFIRQEVEKQRLALYAEKNPSPWVPVPEF